jgi:glycosyltransferase involved in cell wall biosynthesis
MKIAWVSPLPPTLTGIADYSFELLPLLAERAEVHAVTEIRGWLRKPKAPPGIPVVSNVDFARRAESYDAVFFHLGNNPWHRFVYELAMTVDGVQVFHDFVMHHLLAAITCEDNKDWERYRSIMRTEYPDVGERLALLRWHGVATEFEKFLFPLNEHLARRARAIVVHSEDSRDRMLAIIPEVPVVVIPHHAGAPPARVAGVTREEARASLGLPGDAFLVGHFGYITRPKQPAAVVGGFARLAATQPEAQLIMIGADNTGGGMDRLLRRHGLEGRVRMAGFVDLEKFYLYLKAVDAVVNLRYPSAGESSGTFARALAEGRAVIVNNLGSFAEVPPDVALKVEVDGNQADAVGEHLIRLADDPSYRATVEANAGDYARRMLDPIRCRDLYLNVARLETLKKAATAIPVS